ncbi:hypothetical protein OPKNFCMD_6609 [Methylobacterium crusticola]|uniref:Uncharacterized protein n=1 Tax=Methylobacterium crusticola TaxID=1697972 RepID=A0ABQ4RAD0_9HYPH|nr:HGGxSTG domain-containing protein [Methylobacterium crusticola]GJD53830.1 hypothetical protein OPKNFCMD_6609 [Methylobacterium crusticola]
MSAQRKSGDTILAAARVRAEANGAVAPIADRYEAKARTSLDPATPRTAGGELVPADDFATTTLPAILDTLANPDAVAADASRNRLDLAKEAGCLEMGLDTADTIRASDGLERMLAHQLATARVAAMKAAVAMQQHLEEVGRTRGPSRQAACVEAERMARAYARLTGSFQAGMQTLQRVRSGGRQVVVVQHNHIGEGAQAVVAGSVTGGLRLGDGVGVKGISGDQPHAPCSCDRLRGAFAAPRCGARRRDKGSCRQPAMANGRCRMQGGASTGPQTPEGLERSPRSTWKHGRYSAKAIAFRRRLARTVRDLRAATRMVEEQ